MRLIARWLVVVAFVAIWMLCGFIFRLSANAYLLLGVPLVVVFQLRIARQPLRSMWLRAAPPLALGVRGWLLAAPFAIAPAYGLFASINDHQDPQIMLWLACAIVGCAALAYACVNMSTTITRAALRFAALALFCGLVVMASAAIAQGRTPWIAAARLPGLVLDFLLYLSVMFVLEEVVFRGALDSYVGGTGTAGTRSFVTAIGVAALWGVWHLPVTPDPLRVATVVQLLAIHVPVGVFLAFTWRTSGSLLLPATVHALIDAYRNAVLG